MQLILKREWHALDATNPRNVVHVRIPAGTHEVERIKNPCGHENSHWLVLKGTKIGASEGSWRQWSNDLLDADPGSPTYMQPIDWKEDEVVVKD